MRLGWSKWIPAFAGMTKLDSSCSFAITGVIAKRLDPLTPVLTLLFSQYQPKG
ncbi:hypothetical protein V22_40940 [Calycomorphotria hydatis]|uniref:Uncharacterized protein n=1 Tax=Calycomorphotria hydatis TaxID=2528027 RepID=A0A517TEM2_9PLAN|nr:hypothetical protein V22_40940 [Calycomorphotria hydatis]